MENIKVVEKPYNTYEIIRDDEVIGVVYKDGDDYAFISEYNGLEHMGYISVEEATEALLEYVDYGRYEVYKAENMTVAELIEFLKNAPQDYIISIMGKTDIYINIGNKDSYITFDEYDLNEY